MFDIGWDEMLFTAIIAIVVIGPKDLPKALRVAGQWMGKVRRVSGHFRAGIENMIREAELEEMEKKWREQNEAIMREQPIVPDAPAFDATGAGAEPQGYPDPLLPDVSALAPPAVPAKPKRKAAPKAAAKPKAKPASNPAAKPRARKPKADA